MSPSPTYVRRVHATNSLYDADAQMYFNQLTGQQSLDFKTAINTLVVQLKADNNWDKLDRLWIHATEVQQNARVSLVNPTSTQLTEVNSPTWTINEGYTGNGTTQYVNTNYNPTTDGIQYTLNSAMLFSYSRTNAVGNTVDFGSQSGVNNTQIYSRAVGDKFYAPTNENGAYNGNANADSRGLFAGLRTGANSTFTYKNGVLGFSRLAANPAILLNMPFYILASNSGVPVSFSTRQIAITGTGSGTINQATFYTALQTFATTRNFNV